MADGVIIVFVLIVPPVSTETRCQPNSRINYIHALAGEQS